MSIACLANAADVYGVPVTVIEHVLRNGGGHGVGPMGIDSGWLGPLARVGFPISAVETDSCANIAAGTWILAFFMGSIDKLQQHGPGRSLSPPGVAGAWGTGNACVVAAAKRYDLPSALLAAVLATEGGQVGQTRRNTNGSYDIGPAQVNSSWLPRLAAQGITEIKLLQDGCLNITVGAWILGQEMAGASLADPSDYWKRVGNYNSHTPRYNHAYQMKVWQHVASK
jgi:hypothetical protein